MKRIVFLLSIILVLSACGTANNDNSENTQGASDDRVAADSDEMTNEEKLQQIMSELSFNTEINEEEELVTFNFSLENNSEESIDLMYPSGQQFEIVVTDQETNEEVYRYSYGKAFTLALVTETLDPGDSKAWTEQWDYMKDGHRVDAKEYDVSIQLVFLQIDEIEIQDTTFMNSLTLTVPEQQIENQEQQSEEKEQQTEEQEEEKSKRIVEVEDSEHFKNVVVEGENGQYRVTGEANVKDGSLSYSVEDGHFVFVNEDIQLDTFSEWAKFEIQIEVEEASMPRYGVLSLYLIFKTEESDELQYHYVQLEDFN